MSRFGGRGEEQGRGGLAVVAHSVIQPSHWPLTSNHPASSRWRGAENQTVAAQATVHESSRTKKKSCWALCPCPPPPTAPSVLSFPPLVDSPLPKTCLLPNSPVQDKTSSSFPLLSRNKTAPRSAFERVSESSLLTSPYLPKKLFTQFNLQTSSSPATSFSPPTLPSPLHPVYRFVVSTHPQQHAHHQ